LGKQKNADIKNLYIFRKARATSGLSHIPMLSAYMKKDMLKGLRVIYIFTYWERFSSLHVNY